MLSLTDSREGGAHLIYMDTARRGSQSDTARYILMGESDTGNTGVTPVAIFACT